MPSLRNSLNIRSRVMWVRAFFNTYKRRVIAAGGVIQNEPCAVRSLNNNLLRSASWTLVPSGIEEDVVFAQKPTSGLGDLTFTRASDATYTDSTGVVRRSPYNLLTFSEQFDNAIWGKTATTVSINSTVAPNGTLTADTLTADGTNSFHVLTQAGNSINGVTYTHSIYAKRGTNNFIQIIGTAGIYTSSVFANFDLLNGTLGSSGGGAIATITDAGNGWYRCTMTSTATATTTSSGAFFINIIPSATSARAESSTLTTSVFVWGAQLVEGTSALDYFPTTNRQDVPRIDFRNADGTLSSCGRLLLEPQRTNLTLYSEEFDQATWTKVAVSITANTITSPDGTTDADTITANGVTTAHSFFQTIAGGSIKSISIYAKAGTHQFLQILTGGTSTPVANYDLVNGTTNMIGSLSTSSIQNAGNGWYRCILSTTDTSATNPTFAFAGSLSSPRNPSVATSGTMYIWGCQIENAAYPTTYIPTTTAAVTRIADAASKTGVSSIIGQTEGTLFAEVNWGVKPEAGSPIVSILTLNNNVTNAQNAIILGIERASVGTNRIYCLVNVSNVTQAALFGSTITSGNYKIALAYKQNDFVLYVNGAQIATDPSGSVPTTSQILLGQRINGDTVVMADGIAQAALFLTRLTNAQLAELTTL